MDRTIDRFAPLAGIAAVVLLLASVMGAGDTPLLDDPASDIVDFYGSNSAQVRVSAVLAALAALALLIFASRLASALRQNGTSRVLPATALGGAVIFAGFMAFDAALGYTLADSVDKISADALQAVFAIRTKAYLAIHIGLAIFVAAASVSALGSRLLPVWVAVVGTIAAVLLIVPAEPVSLTGLALAGIWIIATSVLLYRRPVPESASS